MRHIARLRGIHIAFAVALCTLVPFAFAGSRSLGTTYLPLDHWAYPVVERAMAMGAIPDQFLGQRPWTRTSVALLLLERHENPQKYAQDDESLILIHSLEVEFAPEIHELEGAPVHSAEVQELYTRVEGIGGTPLRDSYNVGQTIVNDFGRPYGQGLNNVTGGIVDADEGIFGFEGRGEYQHSPGITPYSPTVISTLAGIDKNPTPTTPENDAQDNGQLLDTYVSATWKRAYFSFGRESNWWGPGEDSAMLMTDNVVPLYMAKFDVAEPITLPWILKYLGPLRYQMYMAKLKGHLYPRQPYLHGEKVSVMPTKNLEIGFSRTTVWAGFGRGITWHRLFNTYFSVGDQANADNPGLDAGDRRGGLDVTYKFPGLRNWLTVYMDSFVDDDPSPLAAPNRAAFHPGFYLSHLPKLSKLDFRAEAAYTELPTEPNYNGFFFYTNSQYRDGYTQEGLLLGDWVGREGIGGQLTTTYWLAPDHTVQLYWRAHEVAPDFIPGGARQNDIGTNILYAIGEHWQAGAVLQYERYNIPLLAPGNKSDVTVGLTISYWPRQNAQSK